MSNSTLPSLSHEQQKAIIDTNEVLAAKEDVLKQLGQIEAFDFMSRLSTVATLRKMLIVKESKAYVGIIYKNEQGELATIATWDEFCEHKLPWSRRSVDEKLQNLQALGDEYFEAANKVGLSTKDMRLLRALPSDDRLQVLEHDALESGDKEVIREVIDDLHSKYKKEKSDLNHSLKETQADLAAAREINADKSRIEEELRLKLEKAKYTPENWQPKVIDTIETMVLSANGAFLAEDKLGQIRELIFTESTNGENSHEAMEHITSVYMDLVDRLAQRFALLLADAVEDLPFQHLRKPAEEVLQLLAERATDNKHNGTL